MRTETFTYAEAGVTCEAFAAHPAGAPRGLVLVTHQWAGLGALEQDRVRRFANLGYLGVALDVYGRGRRGDPAGDNTDLMAPWIADRAALERRLLAGVSAAADHAPHLADRIAVVGYCFGGLCALDVARSGTSAVRGVVSVHGVFQPAPGPCKKIVSKVLVLHGWEDPMAPPSDVQALAAELTGAGADWQLHAYGHALHAFTSPGADSPEQGVRFDPDADRRSWIATRSFLEEVLR